MNSSALSCCPCKRQALEKGILKKTAQTSCIQRAAPSTAPRALSGPLHVGTGWWDGSPLPKTRPQLLSQTHHRRAPGSSNTPVHTCSKQGTHMLNSGSPRYKRLGVGGREHLESRLLPKSIGICVSPPLAPISGSGGHNSRCGYPPPTHSHRAASFSTTSARGWSWETAIATSFLPPLSLVLSLSYPF